MSRGASAYLAALSLVVGVLAVLTTPSGAVPPSPGAGVVDSSAPGYYAQVATLPDGTTLAVWRSGTYPDYYLKYSVHLPGRSTWQAPKNVPGGLMHVAHEVQMQASPEGSIILTWLAATDDTTQQVRTAAFTSDLRWRFAKAHAREPGLSDLTLDVDRRGGITIAWRQFLPGGNLVLTRYTPRLRGGWGPVLLVPGATGGYELDLTTAANGRQVIAFTQWDGIEPDPDTRRAAGAVRNDPTGPWQATTYLSSAGTDVGALELTEAGDGVMIAWNEYDSDDVQVRLRSAGGGWQSVQVLGTVGGDVLLDTDARGRVTLVYEAGLASEPLITRRWNGTWSDAQVIAENVNTYRTSLDVSPSGRAAVLFRTNDDDQNWVTYRKGAAFRAPKPLAPSSAGQIQADAVEVDEQGNAVYLWNSAAESKMLYALYDYGAPRTKVRSLKFKGKRLLLRWKSKDRWSPASLKKLQHRQAKRNGRLGPWRNWSQGVKSTRATKRVNPNRCQCIRIRSVDAVGNTEGPWRKKCIPGRR